MRYRPPRYAPSLFTAINEERFICPGSNGGKNWPAGAYSPLTNAMYMPMQNMCMTAMFALP